MSGVQTVFDRIAWRLDINGGGQVKTIVTMEVLDSSGNVTGPLDLSNHDAKTFRAKLANNDGTEVGELTIDEADVLDAANGKIQVRMGSSESWTLQTSQTAREGRGDVFAELNGLPSFVCAFFWTLEERVTGPENLVTTV